MKQLFPSCFFWSLPDTGNTAFVVPYADSQSLIYGCMNSVRLVLKQNPKPFKLSSEMDGFLVLFLLKLCLWISCIFLSCSHSRGKVSCTKW